MDVKPTERVAQLLKRCGQNDAVLPPTALYNEGWMLRLVLDWAERHPSAIEPLHFMEGAKWYSEALLSSRFKPRRRGDPGGEGFTHADGVIGHFRLRGSRGDIELLKDARQLTVVEAKMASGLSSGTSNARTFNQAARNIACLAHLVSSAATDLRNLSAGFVLLAPQSRIDEGVFADALNRDMICTSVKERADAFDAEAVNWCTSCFEPLAQSCSIAAVSWEAILATMKAVDAESAEQLADFYDKCLRFNPIRPLYARQGAR
jgi:hypothetical protein